MSKPVIISIDQAYCNSMNAHPILYASINEKESRLKFYDQVFNTIGNGFNELELFLENFSKTNKNELFSDFDKRYHDINSLFLVFNRITYNPVDGYFTCDELSDYSDESKYKINPVSMLGHSEFNPYPNFQKKYSMLFNPEIQPLMDISWLDAMEFFYQECLAYFNSDRVYDYHYYHPREDDHKAWDKIISDYQSSLKKYADKHGEGTQAMFEAVSKDYNAQYDGDIKSFIKDRSKRSLKEVLSFIDEAFIEIKKLKSKL